VHGISFAGECTPSQFIFSMKRNVILGTIGIMVMLGIVVGIAMRSDTSATMDGDEVRAGGGVKGGGVAAAAVIRRTNEGYEPGNVTVRQGETVSFANDSDEFHWPASDVHPTHSIYSAFDPREPIPPGETWSFTFDQAGAWAFHDHLRANYTGSITVEPVH